ncbi:protein of unknown function [Nitrospina watsonii]|uniref:Uncharacterized protein n=1 Tax=Nitrospina watsonii TaxID=1323948 RepID=A0ABM9HB86_9BACT|nr:protein of unknown function [Nitrospina watsonii]
MYLTCLHERVSLAFDFAQADPYFLIVLSALGRFLKLHPPWGIPNESVAGGGEYETTWREINVAGHRDCRADDGIFFGNGVTRPIGGFGRRCYRQGGHHGARRGFDAAAHHQLGQPASRLQQPVLLLDVDR